MGKPPGKRKNHKKPMEKPMGKSRESIGKPIGKWRKSKDNHRTTHRIMGKSNENHKKTYKKMGNSQENDRSMMMYSLVNIYIHSEVENHHPEVRKIHCQFRPFSIAM